MQQELSEVYFYLKGTLKYKRIAVLFALLLCCGVWPYVFLMEDKYESKAKVHIDSTTIIRPLMRGMVIEPDVGSLIRLIQQLMFTRPNLEKIIELAQLKPPKAGAAISNDLIEQVKSNISIGGGRSDIYDIGYSSNDPEKAKTVVQAVLTVFSEQTQGKALADTSDAQRFIEQQLREYEIRLQEAEKAKEEFKRTNIDLLQGSDQFGALQQMKGQLEDAKTALQQAVSRRDVLAGQIQEVQDSEDDWGLEALNEDVSASACDSRIEGLIDKRTQLLLKYTERHPEIKEIDKLIESLKQQQQQQEQQRKLSEAVPGVALEGETIEPKKMSNPYVQSLKMAFNNAQAEVASAQALVDSIKARISKLEEGLNERLTIETEMVNLNRDYETISGKYSELLDRREQAHITERVDDETKSLKFKIADPPTKPTKPSYPNRKLYYSVVLIGSLIAGFAVAFLIYFIRPVFMSNRQVRVVTGLPSLGSVSLTSQGISKTGRVDWLLILTITVMISGYCGVMLFEIFK